MANSQDILLTYKTDTGEVTKSLDDIVSGLEGVDNKIEETARSTKKVEAGLKATGKAGSIGFQAIGGAIKATGIGLLVAIVAKLIQKFTENKKVAEALEVVFAGIGAVINQLFEVVQPLGDALIDAFSNPMESIKSIGDAIKENLINRFEGLLEFIPAVGKAISLVFKGEFQEAGKVAADAAGKMVLGVEDITDKVSEAAEAVTEFANEFVQEVTTSTKAATGLAREQQKLRDQQRELNVEYAQARAEIEQLKQKRDDERLSIEERIAAAQRAAELDQQFAQERMDIATSEVALIQREIAIQGDSIERQDELAEARIAAAEAAESSAAVQTELMTSIYGLNQEAIAIEDEKIAKEQEAAETRKGLLEQERKLKEDNAAKEIADGKAVLEARIQFANQVLDTLRLLNDAFSGDSEKQQKKAFQRNKAIGISTAIINTAGAIIGAINPASGGLGIPAGLPGAAIAAATGAAQIATIAKSRFKSAGSPPPAPSGGGGGDAGIPAPTSPQLDLSFLGGGAGQDGFRTYVIASEVSNSQQANQKINDQAALVG